MIRIFKFVVSSLLTLCLILFGVFNSHKIDVYLYPNILNGELFYLLNVPLYFIVLVSIFIGFILGCILENVRSNKIRKYLKRRNKELHKRDIELQNLKKKLDPKNDKLLSLLE